MPSPMRSQRSTAWPSVFTQDRSAAVIGCKGSIATGIPTSLAYSVVRARPSATISRAPARSRDPGGSPPTTITRHAAPMAAASSTARRLSSRTAGVRVPSRVNHPPRHNPETVRPASRIIRAPAAIPASCSLSRHGAIPPIPWRTQPSTHSVNVHCFDTVAVLSDRRSGAIMRARPSRAPRRPAWPAPRPRRDRRRAARRWPSARSSPDAASSARSPGRRSW